MNEITTELPVVEATEVTLQPAVAVDPVTGEVVAAPEGFVTDEGQVASEFVTV